MKLTATFQPKTLSVSASAPELNASTGIPVARERNTPAVYHDDLSITANPILGVNYATGEITASNDANANISPVETGGIANPSDSVPVHVGGNTATQLYTLDATFYTPSKQAQIIEAGRLLTGDQTIEPIPPQYYDMSGDMSWLGKDAELVDGSVYSIESTLANTTFATWTPSTTASTIVSAVNAKTFAADLANYEYYLVWDCRCDMDYTDASPTLKAHFLFSRAYLVQEVMKRPSTFANIQSNTFDGNVCASLYNSNFLRYYGTTTGSVTYSWAASYGIYFAVTAATFSNTTSNTPTVTIKTPTVAARCSTTYFSTANAAKVNKANSEWSITGKLYRIKKTGIVNNIYQKTSAMIS